jgi:hypothetical protein
MTAANCQGRKMADPQGRLGCAPIIRSGSLVRRDRWGAFVKFANLLRGLFLTVVIVFLQLEMHCCIALVPVP